MRSLGLSIFLAICLLPLAAALPTLPSEADGGVCRAGAESGEGRARAAPEAQGLALLDGCEGAPAGDGADDEGADAAAAGPENASGGDDARAGAGSQRPR